ncbi:MAG: hypothetical protein ABUT20_34260 [Bacteroidota bacterium]
MNEIVNQLAQSLFKKNSLQECSRWELEILADHYPYFGIAQFLVAGKLKEENAETYNKQLEKTSLYFTNPLWLDYVINNKSTQSDETSFSGVPTETVVADEIKQPVSEEISAPSEIHTAPDKGVSQIEDKPIVVIETKETVAEEIISPDISVTNAEIGVSQVEDEPIIVNEFINTPFDHSFTENEINTETQQQAAGENETVAEEIISPDISVTNTEIGVSQIEDEPIVANEFTNTPINHSFTENEIIAETEQQTEEENVISDSSENAEEELKMKPFKFEPLQESDLKTPLSFEPYHTVDYFASQGIKVAQVEKPKDRFDQQLKSFTQWLKTIKKVPVSEIAKEVGVESEQKVITLAEHSIVDREIVTEAMAEVWTKQGNKEKAIEVYHKLSLQNPAKSSYFAGLIEQLKQE